MQEVTTRPGESTVGQILDRVKSTARVEVIFGESREMYGKTIVPVAMVSYVFGGGEGTGTPPGGNGRESVNTGSGGGGAVRVTPVAVLEVTGDETRLVPIIDWSRIIGAMVTFAGVWMMFRTIFRRRK